jgi:hypothetical protein
VDLHKRILLEFLALDAMVSSIKEWIIALDPRITALEIHTAYVLCATQSRYLFDYTIDMINRNRPSPTSSFLIIGRISNDESFEPVSVCCEY